MRYLIKMTGLSCAQVDQLVRRFRERGAVKETSYRRHRFPQRYTSADIELLAAGFPEQTTTFKEILDTTTHEQMSTLCEFYPGFYRFAKLVESIVQGIQDGTLEVPPR